MFRFFLRTVWRLLILALGVISLLGIVMALWPESNGRMAIFFTLLITYCLMAYLVIPNLVRLFHVFSRPNHIPLYAATGDGYPSDPVNIALVVNNRTQLESVMKKAGWHIADPLTPKTALRGAIAIALHRSYPEAPLTNLYLFDRPQDISFEMSTSVKNTPHTRHHVRFWRLQEPIEQSRNNSHYHFWSQKIKEIIGLNKEIWIGAATEDHRLIGIRWRTGQITHGVSHDSDRERDFIITSLRAVRKVSNISVSEPGERLKFHGQLVHIGKKHLRMSYISDGSIKIVHVK